MYKYATSEQNISTCGYTVHKCPISIFSFSLSHLKHKLSLNSSRKYFTVYFPFTIIQNSHILPMKCCFCNFSKHPLICIIIQTCTFNPSLLLMNSQVSCILYIHKLYHNNVSQDDASLLQPHIPYPAVGQYLLYPLRDR